LKLGLGKLVQIKVVGSIHPQGWVPIETMPARKSSTCPTENVAFTPKGGCPLKHRVLL